MTQQRSRQAPAGLVLLSLAFLSACTGVGHRLGEYDFSQGSVAVAFYEPPAPEIRSGGLGLSGNPVSALISAGTQVARDAEAGDAVVRLDSAAHRVDFAALMAERTLERASRYLGARPVTDESEADFVLEVDLEGLGLSTASSPIRLFVSGEAILLDRADGSEIWRVPVHGSEPLSRDFGNSVLNQVVGTGSLEGVTVEQFELLLGQLAEYAGDRVARALRRDLREVR